MNSGYEVGNGMGGWEDGDFGETGEGRGILYI